MSISLPFCLICGLLQLLSRTASDADRVDYIVQDSDYIILSISNIRNREGFIRIGMYRSEEGYPDNPRESFSAAKDTIVSGSISIKIPAKQPGMIGFSILDDENGNGKMDYILGIIPKEGFGFSNNPKITARKPPTFGTTCFLYKGGVQKVEIRLTYM